MYCLPAYTVAKSPGGIIPLNACVYISGATPRLVTNPFHLCNNVQVHNASVLRSILQPTVQEEKFETQCASGHTFGNVNI